MYRLDRTAFTRQSVAEAANQYAFWRERSRKERLRAAFYLILTAWNLDIGRLPRLAPRNISQENEKNMASIFHPDFIDFLQALNQHQVQYILVGGYAVILHGYPRVTGDMDIWVNQTEENYQRLEKAFATFGMPMFDMTKENFLENPEFDVFSFGVPPVSIDLMTKVKGLVFNEVFEQSDLIKIQETEIRLLHLDHLRKAKKASGRSKDLNDLENLGEQE